VTLIEGLLYTQEVGGSSPPVRRPQLGIPIHSRRDTHWASIGAVWQQITSRVFGRIDHRSLRTLPDSEPAGVYSKTYAVTSS
jgi:hypothetical protein